MFVLPRKYPYKYSRTLIFVEAQFSWISLASLRNHNKNITDSILYVQWISTMSTKIHSKEAVKSYKNPLKLRPTKWVDYSTVICNIFHYRDYVELWWYIFLEYREGFNKIYSLSFQWFDGIAISLVIIVGLIVSKIVGKSDKQI